MDRAQEVVEFDFDSGVQGAERLPRSGPALLVGNHSGPNSDPDTPALMAAWYRKNSVDNPVVVRRR